MFGCGDSVTTSDPLTPLPMVLLPSTTNLPHITPTPNSTFIVIAPQILRPATETVEEYNPDGTHETGELYNPDEIHYLEPELSQSEQIFDQRTDETGDWPLIFWNERPSGFPDCNEDFKFTHQIANPDDLTRLSFTPGGHIEPHEHMLYWESHPAERFEGPQERRDTFHGRSTFTLLLISIVLMWVMRTGQPTMETNTLNGEDIFSSAMAID